jgi:molybdopterin converting factor small subunit
LSVTVRYLGQARRAAGKAVEEIEIDSGLTISALLRTVAERHPGLRGLLLTETGAPRPSTLLFVGDVQAETGDRPLCDGDTVTVLTPMAGG